MPKLYRRSKSSRGSHLLQAILAAIVIVGVLSWWGGTPHKPGAHMPTALAWSLIAEAAFTLVSLVMAVRPRRGPAPVQESALTRYYSSR